MHWIDAILQSRSIKWFLSLIAVYLGYQIWLNYQYYGTHWSCWDFMMISGFLAFIAAVWLAADLNRRLNRAIDQLRLNNVLVIDDTGVAELKQEMSTRGRSVQVWSGILITLVIFGSYLYVFGPLTVRVWTAWQSGLHPEATATLIQISTFTFVSALGAALAGMLFGRLTHYGRLAGVLSKDERYLRIVPGHADGACGLKPIGDYYLYQALVFAVPIIWLSAWWAWLIPSYEGHVCAVTGHTFNLYGAWQNAYLVQWLVVLLYFYMGFVWPFLALRRRIKQARKSFNTNVAARLQNDIYALQNQLAEPQAADATQHHLTILPMIDAKSKELWAIRHMSGWPMDAGTLAKYRSLLVGEVALPLIAAMTTSDKTGGSGFDLLNTWLSKLI